MSSHTAIPGTKSSGDAWTAANVNDLPGGWVYRFSVASDQGSITTGSALTGLATGSITVPSSRLWLFNATVRWSSTSTGDIIGLYLKEDGSDIKVWNCSCPTGNNEDFSHSFWYAPSSGTHEYHLSAARATGAGTWTLKASAGSPCQFWITDLGPA